MIPADSVIARAGENCATFERSSCNQGLRARADPGVGVVCAENLAWMGKLPDACCHLIYVDPPFSLDRGFVGSSRSSIGFADRFDDGLAGLLEFLRPRLARMHELLARRGSLCVHLDWRSVHYVKVMLDEIFGPRNFLNEIIWQYRTGGRHGAWFSRKHDTLLLYAKHAGEHTFNRLRGGAYRTRDLSVGPDGRPYKSTRSGRIYFNPDGPAICDVWDIPFLSTVSKERTDYPTQKPEALLERVIKASTNAGDLVADFFCGSGTTLAVAKKMNRRYLGCDVNPDAVDITLERLDDIAAVGPGAPCT